MNDLLLLFNVIFHFESSDRWRVLGMALSVDQFALSDLSEMKGLASRLINEKVDSDEDVRNLFGFCISGRELTVKQ
jgi:hypothetical protein